MTACARQASYVTDLESAIDGTHLPHDRLQTVHEGHPLWVRYDLDAVRDAMSKEAVAARASTMWRYEELLPVDDPSRTKPDRRSLLLSWRDARRLKSPASMALVSRGFRADEGNRTPVFSLGS